MLLLYISQKLSIQFRCEKRKKEDSAYWCWLYAAATYILEGGAEKLISNFSVPSSTFYIEIIFISFLSSLHLEPYLYGAFSVLAQKGLNDSHT